ncbi:hypothetical protein BN946_scf184894.g5 [Trametes cinnabarina]|uniref:Uncharacterized protein n=1 Tax=Pycnoporus cinnabarinus TaxID=5643 RepID=A0A060SPX2_PYCCI|nr:hypothetical protein BN946_scf184894.g5 [Trametes cinnabarina]
MNDELPQHLADAYPEPVINLSPSPQRYQSPTVEDVEEDVWETPVSTFGTFRQYTVPPQRNPEADATLESVCDAPGLAFEPASAAPKDSASTLPENVSWLVGHVEEQATQDKEQAGKQSIGPFDNPSQFRLFDWHYNASLTKSKDDFDDLLDDLRSQSFSVDDLAGFSAQTCQDKLDSFSPPSGMFSAKDGWREDSVNIPLPKTRHNHGKEADAPHFKVDGVYLRRLVTLIRAAAEDKHFVSRYNWIPHMFLWQPPSDQSTAESPTPGTSPCPGAASSPGTSPSTSPPDPPDDEYIRIITDIFNSNAAIREFNVIRQQPRNPDDAPDVEYVMAPMLIWSDATHLTSFGSASLWPIYAYLGALLKYIRGKPTEFAAHHIAYIPSLPDALQDYYLHVYGTPISSDVLTFCKRELMQRIWLLLLDDEFLDAYEHGILVKCGDGVTRRIFPRILTYSADYPEKILLTALKPLSKFPCPRCLVPKDEICLAGMPGDMDNRRNNKCEDTPALQRKIQKARKLVFNGVSLASKRIEKLLNPGSFNPIQAAFSARLLRFKLNHYQLFVPDLMHEFELGVWKNTFAHLLRLLTAQGDHAVHEFNRRMCILPTFGKDTIRKFWHDAAARKQLAARDYEDFLSCMMPVFEGLLPLTDDQTIADLLFELANWHALAKLRLHTSTTIDIFRAATEHMCQAMRNFARSTCEEHETRELPKETEARVRQEEKKAVGKVVSDRSPKIVKFNVLNTFKYHSLPDYPDFIEEGGTTDNVNTQVAELEHRHVKRLYRRTNRIRYALQIAKHHRCAALLRALRQSDDYLPRRERLRQAHEDPSRTHPHLQQNKHPATVPSTVATQADSDSDSDETPAPSPPMVRYTISQTRRVPLRLHNWLKQHEGDATVKNFIPLLRGHLFGRLTGHTDEEEFTPEDLDHIHIENNQIYRHKQLRLNYTTYDMRRNQDVINPCSHPDIMLLADCRDPNVDCPFWYARTLDIFHAYVRYSGPDATRSARQWQRVDFLWVRWFEDDPDFPSGFQEQRLPRLRFPDTFDPDLVPFGFVDPHEVIRAAYIMPAFALGTTSDLLGPSKLARRTSELDVNEDYEFYYVRIFTDRDIYMRHLGSGVGHRGIGVSLAKSREHALCVSEAETPDGSSDVPDLDTPEPERCQDAEDDDKATFDEEDGPLDDPDDTELQDDCDDTALADEDGDPDNDWHFDVSFGGLIDEDSDSRLGDEEGGVENDDYTDPYAVEGFAPL